MKRRPQPPLEDRPLNLVGRDHPALHQRALEVEQVEDVQILASRMLSTLRRLPGAALAAPQVGVGVRLMVTQHGGVIANPTVKPMGTATNTDDDEGCLSLPGRWFEVPRFTQVEIHGVDIMTGKIVRGEASAINARMWQHEVDHLDGLLLLGRYPEIRRRSEQSRH